MSSEPYFAAPSESSEHAKVAAQSLYLERGVTLAVIPVSSTSTQPRWRDSASAHPPGRGCASHDGHPPGRGRTACKRRRFERSAHAVVSSSPIAMTASTSATVCARIMPSWTMSVSSGASDVRSLSVQSGAAQRAKSPVGVDVHVCLAVDHVQDQPVRADDERGALDRSDEREKARGDPVRAGH